MGQKIHPTGFRLPVTRNWSSRWYAGNRQFAEMLAEDIQVRDFLKQRLKSAAVSRITIERPAKNARITIFSARPGVVIGKKGEDIENLKLELAKRLGVPVAVNIEEVRKPEVDAQLISESITQQLEKRIMFRRAMKRAMQNAMRLGAQGIKIMSSGRLNGIEIARTEWYREGRVPLHTLRADIDYGFSEAKTTYGVRPRNAPTTTAATAARRAVTVRPPATAARPAAARAAARSDAPKRLQTAATSRPRPRARLRPRPAPPRAPRSSEYARPHRPERPAAKENQRCCNLLAASSARSRRAATPVSPRAARTCRSAISA
jgi:small subunit ribosomal protein S3